MAGNRKAIVLFLLRLVPVLGETGLAGISSAPYLQYAALSRELALKLTTLESILPTSVSHNSAINKQVMLAYQEFPPITQLAQARFPPNAIASAHQHADMLEVFFLQSGEAIMTVNGLEHSLPVGSCIVIEPGEVHELRNTSTTQEMVVTYFGIQIPPL